MIFFLLGLVIGIIGGMGIGGGTILIPGLVFLTDLKQQTIQGINLVSFIPIAITALIAHFRNKNILLKLSFPLILFGIFGAYAGSKLALAISPKLLRIYFGIFLLIMGVYGLCPKGDKKK
ncbi:MAG TPA: sulfite exporter TauE/SafE family protein [Clostridia bacterium]|nr:sulfite exporter TauE/SafE family protein [Clostridia bacterium]